MVYYLFTHADVCDFSQRILSFSQNFIQSYLDLFEIEESNTKRNILRNRARERERENERQHLLESST